MDVVRFINRLNTELREAEDGLSAAITDGTVSDYPQYRAMTGELRGIRRARGIIAGEAGKFFNPDGDEDFDERLNAKDRQPS